MLDSRQTIAVLLALALVAVLTACSGPGETVEPLDVVKAERPDDPVDLDVTEWVLISLNSNSLVAGSTITLGFYNRNEISGNGGCNNYFTRYGASGDGFITISQGIERTKWGCDVPEGVLQQEEAYFEALANAVTYRVMNDRLEFDNAAGETILTFAMQEEPPIDPALDDTKWVLTSLNGNGLPEGSHITLNFAEGAVGGFAGCNAYGGEYTAADGGVLTIPGIGSTAMDCQTPVGVMQQEGAYTDALGNAAAYRVVDDRLEIDNASGETTLVFTRKEEFTMNPSDLVSTQWQLVSMNSSNLIEGSTITLAVYNQNQVRGHAGCRGYVGGYEASGDDIRLLWLTMTGTDCLEQEALMEQEGQYTTVLGWSANYRLSEERLEIFSERGEVLIFEPLPEDADASLEGTTWALTAFIEEKTVEGMDILLMPTDLLAQTAITATFEGGTVSGSAGCNTYVTAYTFDGSFFTFETPIATEMACSDPAGVMEQEQRYLGFLKDVTAHRIYGSQLWLETGDGRALVFTAQE